MSFLRLPGRHEDRHDDGPIEDWLGATAEWSPVEETAEPDGIDEVLAEYNLNPFNKEDREHALDLLALRHYTDTHVRQFCSRIDALLDSFAPGWQKRPAPPAVPVVPASLGSFRRVHALIDDTGELPVEELYELMATA